MFSSSAAVYGNATGLLTDSTPRDPLTPYARTKAVLEDGKTAGTFRAVVLRYFNPIGADPLLRAGRSPHAPKHVLQHLLDEAADGSASTIAGNDWDTRDGTPLRDFIDITDLANAYQLAINQFDAITAATPYRVFTIGTGTGTTIGELITATTTALKTPIRTVVGPRRPGDIVGAAAASSAANDLGWHPAVLLSTSIRHAATWNTN